MNRPETEYLDVVDDNDTLTGQVLEKDYIHSHGIPHRTAHIWIMNGDKELLLQLRSKTKKSFPLYWDISAAGHIQAGETVIQGALRELHEELGISASVDDLTFITKVRYISALNNEFGYVYLLKGDYSIEDFHFEDHEVEAVKYVHYRQLEKMISEKEKDLLTHNDEEKILIDYISKL